MDTDLRIKLVFAITLIVMYSIVFITQKLDFATISALLSAFTNAVVALFTYNLTKRKHKKA